MAKRTSENCRYVRKVGSPGTDANGKCMGFAKSKEDDEPMEICKQCKCCTAAYED